MTRTYKYLLPESELPRRWFNLAPHLKGGPKPPIGPDGQPVDPTALEAVFPANLVEQEMCADPWVDIPEPVLDILATWRPTPLRRAHRLEEALGTPAKIFYKDESVSPPGSHKPNTAVAQAYYNREFGIERLTTETGAGQWGSALSFACAHFGLEAKVFMVRVSFDQKPLRKVMMGVWGGNCVASPSEETEFGRRVLAEDPDTPGSLGIAISEAIEQAVQATDKPTRYCLGSVLNHVLLHQTVIGLEAKRQLALAGIDRPDVVIGCAGGGSNFSGLAFPFVHDVIGGAEIEIIPVEPDACPTMTRGPYVYDHGDAAMMTPLLAMHSLGHAWVPPPLHAGGLRYHGMAPLVSQAIEEGLLKPDAVDQIRSFEAAVTWARSEGFVPAPETSNALACVVRKAREAKEAGTETTILFSYSGHGLLDLTSYQKFLAGGLTEQTLSEEKLERQLASLADMPRPG